MKPNHIGIIMDGNRRWAKSQGLPTYQGHKQGYKNLHELARYAILEKGIKYLSGFVFSTENWNRSKTEVSYLMRLVNQALTEYLDELHKDNIRVLVLGSRERLSKSVLKAVEKAETTTKDNTKGTLALCFNYGGQAEIVDATRKIVRSGVNARDITIESFADQLYHPEVPPVDLIVRTSGEQRLSGFMLWRASYAEFIFMDKHWPDFNKKDIDNALNEYAKRQRRYGK